VSRRGSYGFERRRKETVRRAKQEEKRKRRAERAQEGTSGPEMGAPEPGGPPPGVWEWFSPTRGRTSSAPQGSRPDLGAPDDWILLTDSAEAPPEAAGAEPGAGDEDVEADDAGQPDEGGPRGGRSSV
jgi:hypothetical protein